MKTKEKEQTGFEAFLTLTGLIFWIGFVGHFAWEAFTKFVELIV